MAGDEHAFVGGYQIDPSRANECQICEQPHEPIADLLASLPPPSNGEYEQARQVLVNAIMEYGSACRRGEGSGVVDDLFKALGVFEVAVREDER